MIVISANTPETEKPTLLIENIFNSGTVTVSSQTADGAGANALGDGTFDYWTPVLGAAAISVDMGSPVACSGCGIAAHTLGTIGATVSVQTSADNSAWTTRAISSPLTDETLFLIFPEVSSRYWRVHVTDGPASIGVVKLGKRLIIPTGVSLGHVGVNHASRIELLGNDSVNGQFLGTRIVRRSADIDIDFGMVDRAFVENDFAMFEAMFNQGRTFFYAGSPATLVDDVGYCKRSPTAQEMRPSYEGGDVMSLNFEAQVYVG